jgi:uncharacterized membrane protein YfcA
VLFVVWLAGLVSHNKGGACLQVGLVPEVGDIRWTPTTTITYPAACSFAGVIAGMFGVGGGIVKGPLMLHLGSLPEVAAATSATMILFTAGASRFRCPQVKVLCRCASVCVRLP